MAIARSLSRLLRLPGRIALILGLGALSTAGARADTPEQGKLTASGEWSVRCEGGRVFLSEGGRETELGSLRNPRARSSRTAARGSWACWSQTGPRSPSD